MFFVTGNDKKWAEIEAILGNSIAIERSNIDCNVDVLDILSYIVSPLSISL